MARERARAVSDGDVLLLVGTTKGAFLVWSDAERHRWRLEILSSSDASAGGFKEIIASLKEGLDIRGRELFHPIRLALAGRAGEGELDRVILLLDEAAGASFPVRVKSARERILEFCAGLD